MARLFYLLLTLAVERFKPLYKGQLQLLQARIRTLCSRIDVTHIVPTQKEKRNSFVLTS